MSVIYVVTRPFGAEAQAGFGIGSRLMQAGFMPAVAISFAAAAVVGQNYGSGAFGRVHEVARESIKLVLAFMLVFTLLCQTVPDRLVGIFSTAPDVIAAGVDYLKTTSWAYAASGVVFVCAGLFQGLGNTWPSLAASALRAFVFITPILVMSSRRDFTLHSIWVVSVVTVLFQLGLQQFLLRRELRLKTSG
jgi:Na+-driven multidrug efflux pump